MINIAIAPPKLKTTAIIANILDTPMLNVASLIKLIPRATPMILPIRLPIEITFPNIAIVLFKSSLTKIIDNINTTDNDDRIQDIVTNDRADIILACISDGKPINVPHREIPSSGPQSECKLS